MFEATSFCQGQRIKPLNSIPTAVMAVPDRVIPAKGGGQFNCKSERFVQSFDPFKFSATD